MRFFLLVCLGLMIFSGLFPLDIVAATFDQEIEARNREWLQVFNQEKGEVSKFYLKEALFFAKEEFRQGTTAIPSFYRALYSKNDNIKNIEVLYRVQLSENMEMVYELGNLVFETDKRYTYLVIWSQKDGVWFRELEAVSLKTAEDSCDFIPINQARDKWVQLANAHSAIDLARNTYVEDFVYYHRGKVYQGYENLSQAYTYMNDSTFAIQLFNKANIFVRPDLVFEIGEYNSNGYIGSYLIIWAKQPNGEWKIRFDSNW